MSLHHILFATYAGAHQISRSLRFNSADSANLSRTPGGAGNRKILAGRARLKRATLGATQVIMSAGTTSIDRFYFDSSDRLCLDVLGTARLVTTAVFRDPMAWLDVGFELDVGNGTAASRAKIFIEEVEASAYSTDTRSSIADTDTNWNNTVVHYIGRDNGGNYFGGYMSEPALADGSKTFTYSAVDAVSGVKMPARPNATWGANGFYLDFSDNSNTTSSTLGKDRSGNDNDWTPNNFSVTAGINNDSLTDTPTNGGTDTGNSGSTGNFATANPVYTEGGPTLANGNLNVSLPASGAPKVVSTIPLPTTGKWIWGVQQQGANRFHTGILPVTTYLPTGFDLGSGGDGGYAFLTDGKLVHDDSAYGSSIASGEFVVHAFDADAGKLYFGKWDGATLTWFNSSDPVAGTSPAYSSISGQFYPCASRRSSGSLFEYVFGAEGFFPWGSVAGYKALCTQNLTGTTVALPATFTGNASADGPFVLANGVVETVTINGNVATRGTHFDAVAGGMKLRTSSSSYNTAGSNTISAATYGAPFKYARAKSN